MHELNRVEMRRRATDLVKFKFFREDTKRRPQLDGVGGSCLRQITRKRQRLDAFLFAQRFQRQRTKPFRQGLAAGADQQRKMCELRHRRPERFEYLDLHRRVGDMILAADDMRHRKIDIVDDRGQRVEKPAVLADQYRVGEGGGIDFDIAAYQIPPGNAVAREFESPVRQTPLLLETCPLLGRKLECRAVVNGRCSPGDLPLALALQFERRLVAGIEPSVFLEPFTGHEMCAGAEDLPRKEIVFDPEPCQITDDRSLELGFRALDISVVDPQEKAGLLLAREEMVEHRGSRIADMQQSRGRWGEANNETHRASRKALVIG